MILKSVKYDGFSIYSAAHQVDVCVCVRARFIKMPRRSNGMDCNGRRQKVIDT